MCISSVSSLVCEMLVLFPSFLRCLIYALSYLINYYAICYIDKVCVCFLQALDKVCVRVRFSGLLYSLYGSTTIPV